MNTPKTIHIVPVGDQYQLQISGTGFSPYRVGVPACFEYKQAERAYLLKQGGYALAEITCGTCTVAIGAHTRDSNCRQQGE